MWHLENVVVRKEQHDCARWSRMLSCRRFHFTAWVHFYELVFVKLHIASIIMSIGPFYRSRASREML